MLPILTVNFFCRWRSLEVKVCLHRLKESFDGVLLFYYFSFLCSNPMSQPADTLQSVVDPYLRRAGTTRNFPVLGASTVQYIRRTNVCTHRDSYITVSDDTVPALVCRFARTQNVRYSYSSTNSTLFFFGHWKTQKIKNAFPFPALCALRIERRAYMVLRQSLLIPFIQVLAGAAVVDSHTNNIPASFLCNS